MSVLLLTHHACLRHDMGEGHPECPDRLRAVLAALEGEEFATLLRDHAPLATREQLLLIHPEAHVDAILAIRPQGDERVALDGDTMMSAGSVDAALRATGAAIAGVDAVCRGEVLRAFCAIRPPGHHAEPNQSMGFCLFSTAAIAARHAQVAHGLSRVAVADFDVHHGNGTQAAFWDAEGLFLASSHQMPLYPGTGSLAETGARGNICNGPLHPGANGADFRAVWRDRLLPALVAFDPELLIISAGFDAHAADPLAQCRLREADYTWITTELCALARDGRVVSVLEGGYDLVALAASTAAHVRALMVA
ncbi:acetoin utilization deacetylase AcuC-like enzyme [Humitalea rosea]|uniref:Acetoin utilization deacetylase AcuC-like enzyme n=1 Tax=Humitalea rosea TaxID=990373 RepID=A0A2W7I7T6_9PROT|nr:histone deacetylase family protein [Humitalea rosea]PZW42228.1 acetoin utilization deacetylase AcuC-like enzyme [Humitalea rosea]